LPASEDFELALGREDCESIVPAKLLFAAEGDNIGVLLAELK